MKQRQARLIGTPSQTRRQQELAEKLEKVKEVLEDEKKRQFDEPLFDLTKLRQALDKAIPQPEDVKGFFAQIIKSPSRYEIIFDEAMGVADIEEQEVIEKLRAKEEDEVYDFANNFVRQRRPLPQFFKTFFDNETVKDIFGDIDDISDDENSFTNQDGEAEDNEIITGIRQKDIRQDDKPEEKIREIKLIEQVNMKEGIGRGKILGNKPVFRSVQKSKPFIAEREELKAREGRKRRIQPIPFGIFKEEKLKTCLQFYKLFPWIKDKVLDVFVAPISSNFDDSFFIRSDFYEYISSPVGFAITDDEIEKFYRPKKNIINFNVTE